MLTPSPPRHARPVVELWALPGVGLSDALPPRPAGRHGGCIERKNELREALHDVGGRGGNVSGLRRVRHNVKQ